MISYRRDFHRRVKACGESLSTRNVHRLRVTLRRLIAGLDLAGQISDSTDVRRLREQLKTLLHSLRKLRDLQVQESYLKNRHDQFPELRDLSKYLAQKKHKEKSAAKKQLAEINFKKFKKNISHIKEKLLRHSQTPKAKKKIDRTANRMQAKLFANVTSSGGTVHQVRIEFKKFRYLSEIFDRKPRSSMSRIQDLLGEIQDTSVLIETLISFIASSRNSNLYPAETELLRVNLEKRNALARRFHLNKNKLFLAVKPKI